jgi:TPR repeat protein
MVKDEDVPDLTLTIGETAAGDYPVEVYLLDSGNAPQARRNLLLRVEPPARTYMAGLDLGWASALLDMAFTTPAVAAEPVVEADRALLLARARRLLGEGDIAAARLLLLHLAERGQGEAAYELARTFDQQTLAELGARGMDGDSARALDWYERASQDGNVKATERLKILASLSGTPSD